MEGCTYFIQSITGLEQQQKDLIIDGFCKTAIYQFKIKKEEAFLLVEKGGIYSVIGIKILIMMNEVLPFEKLIEVASSAEVYSEIYLLAFVNYPQRFLLEVVHKIFELSLSTQQIILQVLETASENLAEILKSLNLSIENIKKHCEGKTELFIAAHHKTASILLSKCQNLLKDHINSFCLNEKILSEHLIHYERILTKEYFSSEILQKLETELLNSDISIRKKASSLIKKGQSLNNLSTPQIKTF